MSARGDRLIRAWTRGPGTLPTVQHLSRVTGRSVDDIYAQRERDAWDLLFAAAEERLATAGEHLNAYRSAVEDGLLPPMTTGGQR